MITRYKPVVLFALPVLLAVAALAYAHQGGIHHGPDDSRHVDMHLTHMAALLDKIDASDSQKSQIDGLLRSAFTDLKAAKDQHHAAFGQFHELLFAPGIDRPRIEALRAQQVEALDEVSRNFVKAFADAAEVLSPDQRTALARQIRAHHGG